MVEYALSLMELMADAAKDDGLIPAWWYRLIFVLAIWDSILDLH